MKRLFAAALLLSSALSLTATAQTPGVTFPTKIDISYRIINAISNPEAMSGDRNIGVLVFVKTNDPTVGKFEVTLIYINECGERLSATKTVGRKGGRGGADETSIPVLFPVYVTQVVGVTASGYSSFIFGMIGS